MARFSGVWRRTFSTLVLSLSSEDRKLSTRRWEKLKSYVCNNVQITEILYLLVFVSVQSGVAQDGVFLELPSDVGIRVRSPRIFDRFQPLLFGELGLLRRYGELSRELKPSLIIPCRFSLRHCSVWSPIFTVNIKCWTVSAWKMEIMHICDSAPLVPTC